MERFFTVCDKRWNHLNLTMVSEAFDVNQSYDVNVDMKVEDLIANGTSIQVFLSLSFSRKKPKGGECKVNFRQENNLWKSCDTTKKLKAPLSSASKNQWGPVLQEK